MQFLLVFSGRLNPPMALIQFTRNHTDHSTDKGFQFEFFCDRCGNGFMSEFKASATGMAASALHAAGSLFGGVLGRASGSSYEIERAVLGREARALLRMRARYRDRVGFRAGADHGGPDEGQAAPAGPHQRP